MPALGMLAAGQVVQAGVNAASRMAQNGNHAPPPKLDHFGH